MTEKFSLSIKNFKFKKYIKMDKKIKKTKKERLREDLSDDEKVKIRKSISNIHFWGIIFPGIALLRARCYFTFILFVIISFWSSFVITLSGPWIIVSRVLVYGYLPMRAYQTSKWKVKSIV